MPAVSKKQQKFMGAELARKRKGEKTQTGMSAKQLGDYASTKRSGLPERKKIGKGHWGEGEEKSAGGSKMEVPAESVVSTEHRSKMEKLYSHDSGGCACEEVPEQAMV